MASRSTKKRGMGKGLAAILPQMLGGSASTPVVNLLLLFAGALTLALAAGATATALALRAPIVPALRRD